MTTQKLRTIWPDPGQLTILGLNLTGHKKFELCSGALTGRLDIKFQTDSWKQVPSGGQTDGPMDSRTDE